MLDLFRRLSKSKAGAFVFAIFIAALALGFVMSDVQNLGLGGGATGDTVAEIGGTKVGSAELRDRVQRAFETARRERPELTIQQFVRQGGVDQVLAQLTDTFALEAFAKQQGIGVSRKMEDAVIAAAPAFRGLNGQFDQSQFEQFLVTQRVSEKQIRADLARDLYLAQLLTPATGGGFVPVSLSLPYASMLLEQRQGRAQFVPASAFRGTAPTDVQLEGYYRANAARYAVLERRVIRYALLRRASFEAVAPTEAEIAAAFQASKSRYAGRETRTISQVVVATEAAARAIAAQVSGGTPIADAARAAGLEAVTLADQSQDAFARATAPGVAQAVFATAQGQVAPPTRSGLGWHVARVDAVTNTAARTLDQVRPELIEQIRREKAATGFQEAVARLEDAVGDGATFDEVVAANLLQAQTTPPLLASGLEPDAAGQPPTEMAAIAEAGFAMEATDDPVVEQLVPEQVAALVKTERVQPAAPKPLAAIRDRVLADYQAERGLAEARRIATAIAERVNGGTALAQAAGAAGVALPAAAPLAGRRGELLRENATANPQLGALFSVRQGRARAVPAADRSGWYVVQLDTVAPGDARGQPALVASTRAQFAPVLGQEYGAQLVRAARAAVGVDVNAAAVARLKSELLGNAPAQ